MKKPVLGTGFFYVIATGYRSHKYPFTSDMPD
jgi:hypothetical protein